MNRRRFGQTRSDGKTNVVSYYANHGRNARNCYACDRLRCKCGRI